MEDNTPELSSGTLLELPLDILQSIAKHLILFDYMNFRASCKNLHQTNSPAQWRTNGQYPLLMFFKDLSRTYELLDPFVNVSHTIPSKILLHLESCKDGWLLLSSGKYLEYLNPFKNETGKYPPCLVACSSFGFSTSPTSPNCLTVGISMYGGMVIVYFDAAIGVWEYLKTKLNLERDMKYISNHKFGPKYHKYVFYFAGTDGSIVELKFISL